jgi:hypothetical protein
MFFLFVRVCVVIATGTRDKELIPFVNEVQRGGDAAELA